MTQNTEDLRVKRTHKLLKEALITLIEQEGRNFDTLTVGEITAYAMVSRAAFYRHYRDKYDLVEQIVEDAIKTLAVELDQLREKIFAALQPSAPALLELADDKHLVDEASASFPLVHLFEHFAEHKRFYRALLGERGGSWFGKRMRQYFAEMLLERGEGVTFHHHAGSLADRPTFQEGFIPMIQAGVFLDVITWWLEQDRPYSTRKIAWYCLRLLATSLREANTWAE